MSEKDTTKKGFLQQDFNMENLKALLKKKPKKETIDEVDESVLVDADAPRSPLSRKEPFVPQVPEVNLLPPAVTAEAEAARVSRKFMKASIIVGSVFVVIFAAGSVGEKAADMQASNIEAEAQNLTVEAGSLTPYYQYGQSVDAKRTELYTTTQGEIDYPKIARDFAAITQSAGFSLTSASFSGSGGGGGATDPAAAPTTGDGGACTSPDPFSTESGAGCLSFTISGDRANLLNLFDRVSESDSFLNLYFSQSLIGGGEQEGNGDLTGTVEYRDGFTTQNNFELNDPVVPGLSTPAAPGAGAVTEPATEGQG